MTPAEIHDHGTHSFDAPVDKVFQATVGALKVEGYEVAIANEEKGTIKTDRKLVRADAVGAQSAVAVQRQYIISVKADGNKTIVEAVPRIFRGEADLSDGAVWAMKGDAGEYALWNNLFKDIQDAL